MFGLRADVARLGRKREPLNEKRSVLKKCDSAHTIIGLDRFPQTH